MSGFTARGRIHAGVFFGVLALLAATPSRGAGARWIALTPNALSPRTDARNVVYRGVRAIRLDTKDPERTLVSLVAAPPFRTGTIDVDLAARPNSTADPTARGFAGIVFAVRKDGGFEGVYVRATNGRSSDQERRNHSTQYVSEPEWGWHRLRTKFPSRYESYADLVPGVWTHLRIVVAAKTVRLYVNRAPQPALIVQRIIGGAPSARGEIGFMYGPLTEADYAHLVVRPDA